LSDATLADALGLTRNAEADEEPMESEYSEADLRRLARNKIIFEERGKGGTIPEICEKLREKGYPSSQRTVWGVLHSDEAEAFREELQRVQLRDIALLRAYALQNQNSPDLKALAAAINERGKMLRNMQPNEKSSVTVNAVTQVNAKAETKVMIDLSQMSKDDWEAILRAEEALTKAERTTGPK